MTDNMFSVVPIEVIQDRRLTLLMSSHCGIFRKWDSDNGTRNVRGAVKPTSLGLHGEILALAVVSG